MSPNVVDVSEASFDAEVVERSHQVPVLVDFWAPWCGPCRTLGPILERVADDLDGGLVVAKINSDENPHLSSRMGVRGIPNAILWKDGKPVDGFVGALPESGVRAFLARHLTTPAGEAVAEGEGLLSEGDVEGARAAFGRALAEDPQADGALLGLARVAMSTGDLDAVGRFVDQIRPTSDQAEPGRALKEALALVGEAQAAGTRAELMARLAEDEGDLTARYALAGHEVAAGRYRAALEELLAIVRADKAWRKEAARRAMLTVFNIVGVREPLSDEFRDRLRTLYF